MYRYILVVLLLCSGLAGCTAIDDTNTETQSTDTIGYFLFVTSDHNQSHDVNVTVRSNGTETTYSEVVRAGDRFVIEWQDRWDEPRLTVILDDRTVFEETVFNYEAVDVHIRDNGTVRTRVTAT